MGRLVFQPGNGTASNNQKIETRFRWSLLLLLQLSWLFPFGHFLGKTKNRIRVTSLSRSVTKIVFSQEFWIPLMHSLPIVYDTMGSKVSLVPDLLGNVSRTLWIFWCYSSNWGRRCWIIGWGHFSGLPLRLHLMKSWNGLDFLIENRQVHIRKGNQMAFLMFRCKQCWRERVGDQDYRGAYFMFCNIRSIYFTFALQSQRCIFVLCFAISDQMQQMQSSLAGRLGLAPTARGSISGLKWENVDRPARVKCSNPQDAWMLYLIYIAFSKFSHIKLGPDNSVPEFNNITW